MKDKKNVRIKGRRGLTQVWERHRAIAKRNVVEEFLRGKTYFFLLQHKYFRLFATITFPQLNANYSEYEEHEETQKEHIAEHR